MVVEVEISANTGYWKTLEKCNGRCNGVMGTPYREVNPKVATASNSK